MNRRHFLQAAATVAGAAWAGGFSTRTAMAEATSWKTTLKKGLICDYPEEAMLAFWKKYGFVGVETMAWDVGYDKAEEARLMADRVGVQIHSVMRAWTNFNSADAAVVQSDMESVERALQSAKGYGAPVILLVPCRTDAPAVNPSDFRIEFDPKTLMVSKVVDGDNAPYQAYIDIQNASTRISIECLKKLIPVAEKTGVVIGIENVWNNLWISPELYAAFVRYFDSPWIRSYLDLGNSLKYAPTEKYVYALSDTLVRLHAKDYDLSKGFVELRRGSVNWPAVRKALEEVNYNNYITIEGCNDPIEQQSADLDLILAGK